MKCCKESELSTENNANQVGRQSFGAGIKHMIMMLACCLVPLGAMLLLKQIGYDGAANYLLLLLCPLMHLFMMKGMGHKHQDSTNDINTVK